MNKPSKGISDLQELIKNMEPILNPGSYVFCTPVDLNLVPRNSTICEFKEREATTVVLKLEVAIELGLPYDYIASWITLNIHSSLEAVGLTAAFSAALAEHHISCNVIAAYFHDHIFVDNKDANKALEILQNMTKQS